MCQSVFFIYYFMNEPVMVLTFSPTLQMNKQKLVILSKLHEISHLLGDGLGSECRQTDIELSP